MPGPKKVKTIMDADDIIFLFAEENIRNLESLRFQNLNLGVICF